MLFMPENRRLNTCLKSLHFSLYGRWLDLPLVKIIAFVLLLLLVWLQYKIWLQDGGIPEIIQLQQEVKEVKTEVKKLQERNASLDAEVKDLKKGQDAIEERARSEMGMIKQGEVYYQVIESEADTQKTKW